MKDAVLTIRVPLATRKRIERLAREEGRSLSQQAERLLERGLQTPVRGTPPNQQRTRPLAGVLAGGRIPTLEECRQVRALLSDSLERREGHAGDRRCGLVIEKCGLRGASCRSRSFGKCTLPSVTSRRQ